MDIFATRHGKTNFNERDLCNDDPTQEVHLNEAGISQARILAQALRNISLDVIFISRLPRTKETADHINEMRDTPVPIVVDERIDDRKTGFDSLPVKDFLAFIEPDKFNIAPPRGESFQQEKARVSEFLIALRDKRYRSVLIVTHSEIARIIKGIFQGLTDSEMWKLEIDNCELLHFTLDNKR